MGIEYIEAYIIWKWEWSTFIVPVITCLVGVLIGWVLRGERYEKEKHAEAVLTAMGAYDEKSEISE